MLEQYVMLSMCLLELKKSNLPIIDKLRLEVQLIQTKRLLLDDEIGARVKGVVDSEKEFKGLYQWIEQICQEDKSSEVGGLIAHLMRMKEDLNQVSLVRQDRNSYARAGLSRIRMC